MTSDTHVMIDMNGGHKVRVAKDVPTESASHAESRTLQNSSQRRKRSPARPAETNGNSNNSNGNSNARRRSRSRSRSNSSASRSRRDLESALNDAEPLLETDTIVPPRPAPPLAGPEIDDEDDQNDYPRNRGPQPGVDDGFFDTHVHAVDNHPTVKPRMGDDEDEVDADRRSVNGGGHKPDNNGHNQPPSRRPSLPFPYAPDFPPGVTIITGDDNQPRIIPDVNVYQQKKNLAQGMMDLALLSANANQLRYVLESFGRHPYYYFSVVFISCSLILQVAVGIGLILNSRYNIKNQDDICKADKINNFTIIGIFLITIVNVFIASFGVAEIPRGPVA